MNIILKAIWWYPCLVCFLTDDVQETSGYQIPTFQEVVSNATHVNGPNPPQQLDLSSGRQLLFPFMTFICNGTITSLTFLGWLNSESNEQFNVSRLTSWPYFSLWNHSDRGCGEHYSQIAEIGPTDLDQLNISMLNGNNVLVTINLNNRPLTFNKGDILGVRLQERSISITNGIAISVQSENVDDQTLVYHHVRPNNCSQPNTWYYNWQPAYISIAPPFPGTQLCASGFFNQPQSLHDLLASRSGFLYFPGIPPRAMSMPFTDCGHLTSIFIAAKLNEAVSVSGWPELQIIRMVNNRACVAFTTNTYNNNVMMGPQQTSHHNVYKYDLSTQNFIIQAGDVLNISWCGDVLQRDQIRFSLAYYDNGVPPGIPMVSVEMTNSICNAQHTCETVTDNPLTTSSIPINIKNNITISQSNATTSGSEAKMTSTNNSITVIISGVVSCSLLFSLLLILVVIICVIIVRRRGKSYPVNAADSTEMNRHIYEAQPFQDTTRNGRGAPSENDYVTDDGVPSGMQLSAVVHDCSNQQDDYYYYKLYEWGVFVPTADQRGKLASGGTDNSDDVYSTLGESQYSQLQQFNKAPEFFENTDNYWKPASDTEGLYQQLSSKKYREILRQQIQLFNSLGSGQFGNVMKGVWLLSGGSKEVAVKMLKEEASETEKVRFLQEAAINGQFWHPNVVKLMGVVTIGEPVMIILELLSNGDLRGFLMKMQPTPGEMVPSNTPHTLLRFCKEIAAGMKYLASKGFIHRDLASRNILVSEEKTCKISDFGMSRDLENDSYYVSHGGMIPVKWTAPEALHYKKYSTASDVWSFGCVVYEIWSLGHKPFEGCTNREVISKVDSGFRLPPPPGCPRDIYHIMIQCWHPNKNIRPSFSDLHTSLSDHTLSLGIKTEHPVAEGPADQPFPLLHPQAHIIGALLEAGKELYNDLQNTYINE